jgi:hypothetical protein
MPINADNAVAVTAKSLATIAGMLGHEPEVLSRDAERQPRVVRIDPKEQRTLLENLGARGR